MADLQKANGTGEGAVSDVFGDQAETAFQNDQQANHTPIPDECAISQQEQADAKAKRSRSTSTGAQIAKLLAFLREGPKTTHYLRTHGISHPAGRVQDLRDDNYEILTQRVNTVDAHGFGHVNVAEYVLLKEKPQQSSLVAQEAK
jgi:hypothetical protein